MASQHEDKPPADLSNYSIPGAFIKDGILYPGFPFSSEGIQQIREGQCEDFGVLAATFPRSGTALLIEICWLLLHDLDTEKAGKIESSKRHVYMECKMPNLPDPEPPLVGKTHLSFDNVKEIVEKGHKIVFGIRNPKDALVSFYHFNRMNNLLGLFPGNWDQFMEEYKKGKFPYGDYFDNVLSWWAERHRENILVVHYEDLIHQPEKWIKEISQFLGKNYTDEEIQRVAEFTSFSNVKKQPAMNYSSGTFEKHLKSSYMRKGKAGDWKNYFRDEDNEYIDGLVESRAKPVGLTFRFN